MLDEFYHVGRMDSLISKITISAGYGFRMCIVLQDISQLDELYGKNTRITTLSGSQIKLFIQINDLETSEFVSEMLGETTQVYKTPVMRPGQGIFAPRVWAPHYTPRPLRSPLELREMSDRVSILMVKNSRSFELAKIRHFRDKPYRRLYEAAKGNPPDLPRLREWQDEVLGGAFNPAPTTEASAEEPGSKAPVRAGRPKSAARKSVAADKAITAARTAVPEAPLVAVPLVIAKASPVVRTRGKPLSLGRAPEAPAGESCAIGDVLAAAERAQHDDFGAMAASAGATAGSERLRAAMATLFDLQDRFGDDDRAL